MTEVGALGRRDLWTGHIMDSYRAVMEVLKMLPASWVLRSASVTSRLWAHISQQDELWTELLEELSTSEPLYLPTGLPRKRNFQLQARSRHHLALFREQELLLFNCRTEAWRVLSLKRFTPAIHCKATFMLCGEMIGCGGLDIVGTQGKEMELGAVSLAFRVNIETGELKPTPDMLERRHSHGLVALGDSAFVFGGSNEQPLKSAEVYRLGAWYSLPNMHCHRRIFTPIVNGTRIFLLGGADCVSAEILDTLTLEYQVLDVTLPVSRCWQGVAVTRGKEVLYLAGKSLVRVAPYVSWEGAPFQYGWQDTNPQAVESRLYYQQCSSVGRLELNSKTVSLLEPPPLSRLVLLPLHMHSPERKRRRKCAAA